MRNKYLYISKDKTNWAVFLGKNKCLEIDLNKHKEWQWFTFSVRWSRKCDHAGLHLELEVLGYALDVNLYDGRHWDYEKDQWATYDSDEA